MNHANQTVRAITLGYHDVTESGTLGDQGARVAAGAYALERTRFRHHLEALAASVPGRVSTVPTAGPWAFPSTPVFLSFDDGASGAYTAIADDLESHGWRGHFFITTNWIGRPGFMDRAQIRELRSRGHVIGSHTVSHPSRMSALSWDDLVREWTESCSILADILGEKVETASVADGYYSRKVGLSAASSGLRVLFNSEPVTSSEMVDGCLVLGRYAIHRTTTASEAAALAAGRLAPRLRQLLVWRAKGAVKAVAGQKYLALRAQLLSRPTER